MNSIVTVTTPSDSIDLTVLDTVKLELGITNNDEDAKLQQWITQASAIAARYCNRVFGEETITETFRPDRCGIISTEYLLLSRYPVSSITSVTLDDDDVTADEYELDAARGFLYALDDSGFRSYWASGKSIIVVYLTGYSLLTALPYDVERAVITMVRDMRVAASRGDPSLIEEDIPDIIRRRWWVADQSKMEMPAEIAGLLDRYVVRRIAAV